MKIGSALRKISVDVRASIPMALAVVLLLNLLPDMLDRDTGLHVLARIDICRATFWTLIVFGAAAVLLPFNRLKIPQRFAGRAQMAVLVSSVAWFALLLLILLDSKPVGGGAYKLALLFVLLNLLGAAAVCGSKPGSLSRLARVPLTLELLMPLGFWVARQRTLEPERRLPVVRRVIPVFVLCLAAGLFSLVGIFGDAKRHNVWKLRQHILFDRQKNVYSLTYDADRELAVVSTYDAGVLLVDMKTGELVRELPLPSSVDVMNMGWDAGNKILYVMDSLNNLFALEPLSGEYSMLGNIGGQRISYLTTNSIPMTVSADGCTLWLLLDEGFVARMDIDSVEIQAEFGRENKNITNLVVFEDENLIYTISYHGYLRKLDATDLSELEAVDLDTHTAQIAYDSLEDRLLISSPSDSAVLFFDRNEMSEAGRIEHVLGARAIHVLPEQRLLFVAGFTPYLDIYDLDSFKLLARKPCLPWVRWIVADPDSGRVLLTDKYVGLSIYEYEWAVRLGRLLPFRPRDPFFRLAWKLARGYSNEF